MSDKRLARFARWVGLFGRTPPLHSAEHFSALYDRAHLPVFRYLYGLRGGPAEDVEDLTAETFERAWKARDSFDGGDEAALGWLLTIARRLVIDGYRRKQRRGTDVALDDGLAADVNDDPPTQLIADEQRRTLLALLETLSAEHRELITLRYLLGWRVNRIAEHLGMAENTVSVTLRRILSRLRRDWPQSE